MAKSKQQQQAANKYLREKVDALKVYVPKGEKERIDAFAKSNGESRNAFIVRAIRNQMERDNKKDEE